MEFKENHLCIADVPLPDISRLDRRVRFELNPTLYRHSARDSDSLAASGAAAQRCTFLMATSHHSSALESTGVILGVKLMLK